MIYKLIPRKWFKSGHQAYDVWVYDLDTKDEIKRRLVCSFVAKEPATEYVRFKNSQQKEPK